MQEHAAEPDRGAIHEDEFARHLDRTLLLQAAMHFEGLLPPIMPGLTWSAMVRTRSSSIGP